MLEFFSTILSESFFAQYAVGKGMDALISNIQASFNEKETINSIRELMKDSLYRLYEKYEWEYNSSYIWNILINEVNGIEDITESRLGIILKELIGCTLFGEEYVTEWKDIIEGMLVDEKYKKVYKTSIQAALKLLICKIDRLDNSFERKEKISIKTETSETVDAEFEKAYECIGLEEYEEAIHLFKKIILHSSNKQLKGLAWEKIGYCEYCLGNINKAIEDYKKSLKFSAKPQEKVNRLCAIAKLYTKLGEENNKKENYKRANLYFKEMLDIATIDEDIIEARVHIARNNMDMCDVVNIDEAKSILGMSIIEYIDILNTYPEMDYEIGFVACQNLGRCFVQVAQKLGYVELLDVAEELYLELLNDEITKEKSSWSALILDNLAELYYYESTVDKTNRSELLVKAKVTYKKALACYQSEVANENVYKIYGIRLDLASMEFAEYLCDNDINHLKNAEEQLLELEKEYSYEKENSMHIRICLKMIEILFHKALISDNPQVELEQMQKYILQAKSFDNIHSYEKYAIALELLTFRKIYLEITIMNKKVDYSECIEQLRAFMEKTEDKNVNLYQVAEQTLNMFQEL